MEGSIRQAGSKMRLAVQLVEAISGSNLWAETFERTFNADNVFELQDELVPRIVATVSDTHGILMRVMIEGLRAKPVEQLTAYEAIVRSASFSAERAVKLGPDSSQAWATLANLRERNTGTF
jgi:hypothetical protein